MKNNKGLCKFLKIIDIISQNRDSWNGKSKVINELGGKRS